jgi:hypothetical protein
MMSISPEPVDVAEILFAAALTTVAEREKSAEKSDLRQEGCLRQMRPANVSLGLIVHLID